MTQFTDSLISVLCVRACKCVQGIEQCSLPLEVRFTKNIIIIIIITIIIITIIIIIIIRALSERYQTKLAKLKPLSQLLYRSILHNNRVVYAHIMVLKRYNKQKGIQKFQ